MDFESGLEYIFSETGDHITEDYMCIFSEIFDDMNIGPDHPSTPLEVIYGIAIALAEASGYRVVLHDGENEIITADAGE